MRAHKNRIKTVMVPVDNEAFRNQCIFNKIALKKVLPGCNGECERWTGLECPQVSILPKSEASVALEMLLDEEIVGQASTNGKNGIIYPFHFEESNAPAIVLPVVEVGGEGE